MVKYTGRPAYEGIVLGSAIVFKKKESPIKRKIVENIELEQKRLVYAVDLVKNQLEKLYKKAKAEVGEAGAVIFEVHQMMLEDQDFQDKVHNLIKTDKVNAEYAVVVTRDDFSEMFAAMDDEYMKARSADIKDISDRLVRNLIGEKEKILNFDNAAVIIADDLTPSEIVQLDKDKTLAFVTIHGSANSHTAILARMMKIPAIVSVPLELEDIKAGMQVVVDGYHGNVIFDPSEEILIQTKKRIQGEIESFMV